MSSEKKTETKEQENQSSDDGLNPNVKGIVSLLIFIHVFVILMAVFTNAPASGLARKVRRTPFLVDYLQALYIDSNYRYYMTLQERGDMSWAVRIRTSAPGYGNTEFTFPNESMSSTNEILPYHFLAQKMFEFDYTAENDEAVRNVLIETIGRSQFDQVIRFLMEKYDKDNDHKISKEEAGDDWSELSAYDKNKDGLITGLEIYYETQVSVECIGTALLTPNQYGEGLTPDSFSQFQVYIRPIVDENGNIDFAIFNIIDNNIESAPAALPDPSDVE